MTGGTRNSKGSTRRRQLRISYVETGNDEYESKNQQQVKPRPATRRDRVHPESTDRIRHGRRAMASKEDGELKNANTKPALNVDTEEDEQRQTTPVLSSPRSPSSVRSSRDLRSPGAQKTPTAQAAKLQSNGQALPDFITQTDANGNATTPRSASGVQNARKSKPRRSNQRQGRKGRRRGSGSSDDEDRSDSPESGAEDPCDSLLDSIRLMCCCFGPDDARHAKIAEGETQDSEDRVKLLGKLHPDDEGKKCLVLDLDETLVHSSFRAVPGADFVIPVQIEDVVHFVYVAKRPGVDEFLVEMAKHYEIVIFTASLNKYADPLLDLLDPKKVIRSRLFRESCVYYEGNYVKDLSLLNRDLSKTIIIDNSPSSYMFHPQNAIDCSSFVDDVRDRELDQISNFLAGIRNVPDVRRVVRRWREWPVLDIEEAAKEDTEDLQ